jgi:molybdate transport system permease protein
LQSAFDALGRQEVEAARTLGASELDAFFTIAVPLSAPGFLTATVLSFAHTLGEFGVVLMVGGNIPGETRVVSIAIYDHVESLDYASAHQMSIILVLFAFAVMLSMFLANRRLERRSR